MLRSTLFILFSFLFLGFNGQEKPEYAEIHIFRPKQFQGGAVTFQVLANTKSLTYLSNGSRSILRVYNEGSIDLKLKASVFTSKTVSFGVVKGQNYYVKAGYNDGFGSKLSFVPLTENQGKMTFEDLSFYHRSKIKIIEDKDNSYRALSADDVYSDALKTIEKNEGSKPALGWISPEKNYLKTDVEIFALQLCLKAESDKMEMTVNHNGELFEALKGIPVSEKKCSYTYISNIKLAPGNNKIELIIHDKFGESRYTRNVIYKKKDKVSKRGLALILGNSDYEFATNLPNPKNDADDMKNAFERLDFEVMKFDNLGFAEMKEAIGSYLLKLEGYETGIVFYAGHGIQHSGRNYLVPVDINLENEDEVAKKCIDTGSFITKMDLMEVETSVIILDACRSNPFKKLKTKTSDSTTGLTGTDAPPGTIVAFATAPGKTASDGTGKNGLYTQEILKHIYKPGLKIEDLFKQVRVSVMNKSMNRQIPWETSSLVKDFYFYQESN